MEGEGKKKCLNVIVVEPTPRVSKIIGKSSKKDGMKVEHEFFFLFLTLSLTTQTWKSNQRLIWIKK